MGENIIEIAGLRKSFDHVEVVKGVPDAAGALRLR